MIFRTLGLRPDVPELAATVARGSALTSEMEVFFQVCPWPEIAVTGSDGKTTTTTIIAKLLEAAGRTVHLGGNIGRPLLCDTPDIAPTDLAVLELSSFQLMTMDRSPRIAVMTNLSPNHLDVHKSYGEYIAAKENIFTHQTARDIAVFNADNEATVRCAEKAPGRVRWFSRRKEVADGVFLRGTSIVCRGPQGERVVLDTADIKLPGVHNIENYMAAVAAVDGGSQTRPSGPSPAPSAAWSTGSSWSGSWTASGGTTTPSPPAPAAPSPGSGPFRKRSF